MPTYQTPGVYVEEISAGPRPVQASGTTSTGFVGLLQLPGNFGWGLGTATDLLVPKSDASSRSSWSVASSFYALGWDPKADGATKAFDAVAKKILGDSVKVDPVKADAPPSEIVIDAGASGKIRLDVDKSLVNVIETVTEDAATKTKVKEYTFEVSNATAVNPTRLVDALAVRAVKADQRFDVAKLPKLATAAVTLDQDKLEKVQEALADAAMMVTSMDDFHTWRKEWGRKLFVQLYVALKPAPAAPATAKPATADEGNEVWRLLDESVRGAWHAWIRSQTGFRFLEMSVTGFFANGGTAAYPILGVVLPGVGGKYNPAWLLAKSFNTVGDVAMLVAPGLSGAWQEAILSYARMPAPAGRGDLFAILDAPRYLLSEPADPKKIKPANRRNSDDSSWYEIDEVELLPSASVQALRHNPSDTVMDSCVPRDNMGFGGAYAPWLIVRNPLATSPADAFAVCPPSGYIAGAYALNDNTVGVHKVPANQPLLGVADLVVSINNVEQGPLNVKGINLLRHKPGGILIWGGRTTSTDALWRYINFRRVFLFVERSVRDAVQWAVFLPNNSITRSDLSSTIQGFLYTQWQKKILDGASQKEAFFVKCDEGNNPIETRRDGYLNVDIGIQPPYPAEFVVLRFRQMA